MRVIAGKARGKKLLQPKGEEIRPTLDRVKESLFNIVGFEIRDSVFLDLFCGSGAIGIEAISRGAKKVIFIDKDSASCELTKKNILSCNFESSSYELLKTDVESSLSSISNRKLTFDYIFMDPPYGFNNIETLILNISKLDILSINGQLIVETDVKDSLSEQIGKFTKKREKLYSITKLSFYERTEENV